MSGEVIQTSQEVTTVWAVRTALNGQTHANYLHIGVWMQNYYTFRDVPVAGQSLGSHWAVNGQPQDGPISGKVVQRS